MKIEISTFITMTQRKSYDKWKNKLTEVDAFQRVGNAFYFGYTKKRQTLEFGK